MPLSTITENCFLRLILFMKYLGESLTLIWYFEISFNFVMKEISLGLQIYIVSKK